MSDLVRAGVAEAVLESGNLRCKNGVDFPCKAVDSAIALQACIVEGVARRHFVLAEREGSGDRVKFSGGLLERLCALLAAHLKVPKLMEKYGLVDQFKQIRTPVYNTKGVFLHLEQRRTPNLLSFDGPNGFF